MAHAWAECTAYGKGDEEVGTPSFRLFFSLPPTAFTPEPVRRRVAGMKQILLSVSHAGPSDSGVIIDSIDFLPLIID